MNQNYFVLLQTMKEMMRILFVMNPISGSGDAWLSRIFLQ